MTMEPLCSHPVGKGQTDHVLWFYVAIPSWSPPEPIVGSILVSPVRDTETGSLSIVRRYLGQCFEAMDPERYNRDRPDFAIRLIKDLA